MAPQHRCEDSEATIPAQKATRSSWVRRKWTFAAANTASCDRDRSRLRGPRSESGVHERADQTESGPRLVGSELGEHRRYGAGPIGPSANESASSARVAALAYANARYRRANSSQTSNGARKSLQATTGAARSAKGRGRSRRRQRKHGADEQQRAEGPELQPGDRECRAQSERRGPRIAFGGDEAGHEHGRNADEEKEHRAQARGHGRQRHERPYGEVWIDERRPGVDGP